MNDSNPSFSQARRRNVVLNVGVSVALLLALVVMVNYLAGRHFRRFHFEADSPTQLSPHTRRLLDLLTNTVRVTVYFDSDDDLYGRVAGLLREYQLANPHLKVQFVDYLRDVAAARLVKSQYKLTQVTDKDLIIFDCEGRTRFVAASELSDYDLSAALQQSGKVRRTHFRGEMMFTSALLNVMMPRSLKAYFLRGHGEQSPASTDQSLGYSTFAALLKDECNIPSETLSLLTATNVPADCSLLIVAGPTDPFSKDDLEKLQRYLEQGGRMLALFNYYSVGKPTGLEKLMAQFNVAVGDNVVADIENSPMRNGKGIVPTDLGNHPIVARLRDSQVYLSLPRSIRRDKAAAARAASAQVDELLLTGPNTWIASDFIRGRPQTNAPAANVPLMVAVERGTVPGVSPERGTMRLVVMGDSVFLQNDGIGNFANRDFAAHMVNWLTDQGVLLTGPAPRPIKTYQFFLPFRHCVLISLLLVLGMPLLVLLVGFVVRLKRGQ
jgi:hypothetical protein